MNRSSPPHDSPAATTSASHTVQWELDHLPTGKPPTVASITAEIGRRRRNTRNLSAAIVVLIGIALVGSSWEGANLETAPDEQIAVQTQTEPQPTEDLQPTPKSNGFTLYADIRMDAPVFQYDDRHDAMVPVGWVRSTDRIPVDLEAFSKDQIETFKVLLREEPPKEFF